MVRVCGGPCAERNLSYTPPNALKVFGSLSGGRSVRFNSVSPNQN